MIGMKNFFLQGWQVNLRGPRKDIKGKKFGKLTPINFVGNSYWECLCECGNKKNIRITHIENGHQSCGCSRFADRTKHGLTRRSLNHKYISAYNIWCGIKQRCENKNSLHFDKYGGRGIKICERWKVFENFYSDMGDKPENMSLDRIDVNGNYEKENCRWANHNTQMRNTRGKTKGSSKYKGVVKFNEKKWRARIRIDGKLICLGLHDSEEYAAMAYNKKAKEVWGEDVFLNIIDVND